MGVGVIFVTDGFSTLDPDSELRLSIMSAIAQEESRKTSSWVKWGQTRQMERGVVFGRSMLGYDVINGKLLIDPQGAEIVKQIFYKYGVEKKGTTVIARELRESGFKTYSGDAVWAESQILRILKNLKYVGDLVQKKTITPDYLAHTKKYNRGEEKLIVIKNHHEPVITRELWELVQDEIRKRRRNKGSSDGHSRRYIFSGRIICAECGARFISRKKYRTDGSSYRRWGCYNAVKYGKRKTDSYGNTVGCDVGKLIRDDLAMEMVKQIITNLEIDRSFIIRNVTDLVLNAIRSEAQDRVDPNEPRQQIGSIQDKKIAALDSFLSGLITKDEFQQSKSRYDAQLGVLRDKIRKTNDTDHSAHFPGICEINKEVKLIMFCANAPESFYKVLLEYIIVHSDGTAQIKLRELPCEWNIQLYKAGSNSRGKTDQSKICQHGGCNFRGSVVNLMWLAASI